MSVFVNCSLPACTLFVLFQLRGSSQLSESTPTAATLQSNSVQDEGNNQALCRVLTQCDKDTSRWGKDCLWLSSVHDRAAPSQNFRPLKSNPYAGLDRPLGFQEAEAPRFLDNRHMKAVRLSALSTFRLYPPGNIPGTHIC
jgi:hypothetical protein